MKYIFFVFLISIFSTVHAQKISGVVTDADDNPISDVLVYTMPDSSFAITNQQGQFSISYSKSLVFQKVGYETRSIDLSSNEDEYLRVQMINSTERLETVTVSDFSINQSLLSADGNREYISKKEIELSTPDIITPLLNKQPGIYMHSGALNTNRITIRGIGARSPFSTNKIRAYYGDIPLTNGTGETTIEDIDLSNLGSMEIIKGPNSSIYGSGLGGVMLLRPTRPDAVHSKRYFQGGIGSYGLIRTNGGISMTSANKGLHVSLGRQTSNGYRDNNNFERFNGLITADLFDRKNKFTFLGYFVDQTAFIPSSVNEETYLNDPSAAARNWAEARGFEDYTTVRIGLGWDRIISKKWILKSSLFGSRKENYEPRPFNILDEKTWATGFRSRLIGDIAENQVLMFGTETFIDWRNWRTLENLYQSNPGEGSVAGDELTNLDENRGYINLFGEYQYELSKLKLTAGFNLNSTSYTIIDNGNTLGADQRRYRYDPVFSPRIGFNYSINQSTALFGSVSHGFSTPTLEETLTPSGEINESIEPETGWQEEVGVRGTRGILTYSISAYAMQIQNLLVARRIDQDQFIGLNAGSTRQNGIELSSTLQLIEVDNFDLSFDANYSFQPFRFNEFIDDQQDFSGNQLTGVPENQLFSEVRFRFFGAYLHTNYQFIDEIPITDANDVYSNSYQLVNLQLGYRYQFGNWTADLSGWIRNLADEKYASMVLVNAVGFGGSAPRYYYPGLPRNYFLRLKIEYFIN